MATYLVALLLLAGASPPADLRAIIELGKSGPDTAETSDRLLGLARDAAQPDGVRGQALISYGQVSARRKTGAEAAPAIWALKGKIQEKTGIADPVFEALGALGPPALPVLAEPLRRCGARELRRGRLDNPKATIELDDSLMAASVLVALVREHSGAPEALALAPDLVRGLDCGDASVRQLCARALGALSRMEPREVAAVRRKLSADRRPDVRALSAALLAAVSARDAASVKALERALADRSETVQLSSANALMQLEKPARARRALERLQHSQDPEGIAGLAAGVLRDHPAAAP